MLYTCHFIWNTQAYGTPSMPIAVQYRYYGHVNMQIPKEKWSFTKWECSMGCVKFTQWIGTAPSYCGLTEAPNLGASILHDMTDCTEAFALVKPCDATSRKKKQHLFLTPYTSLGSFFKKIYGINTQYQKRIRPLIILVHETPVEMSHFEDLRFVYLYKLHAIVNVHLGYWPKLRDTFKIQ